MIRVTLVSGTWPPIHCGVGIYSSKLYKTLGSIGLEPKVVTTHSSENLAPEGSLFVDRWNLYKIFSITKTVLETRPEVVHIQYPTVSYGRRLGINFLPFLLRVRGKKVVVTVHEYFGASFLGRLRILFMLLPANRVIVSNDADVRELPFFIKPRVNIIPIGTNIDISPPDVRLARDILARTRLSNDRPLAVFFGLPLPAKRIESLIEVSQKIVGKLQVLITFQSDSSPYSKTLLKNIRKAPAGFVDNLDDIEISAILNFADYFILPQTSPVLTAKSGTAIAAALHGCIIVAAGDGSDVSKPFMNNNNCILLDNMSPYSITKALIEIEKTPRKKVLISKNAMGLSGYFDWNNIAQQHQDLYLSMTNPASPQNV